MAQTVGDFFWDRLKAWGVRRIFGYPGDGINGLLGALQRRDGDIQFVQVRHEEMAAFMAVAHAKFTGEIGVCLATSGPGASHLVTGLYDARLDHVPVLAIVGQQGGRRSVPATSRRSTSSRCSRTWLDRGSSRCRRPPRPGTYPTRRCAMPSAAGGSRC